MKRTSKGIFFYEKVLQLVKKAQRTNESFSNTVNRLLITAENCSAGKSIDREILAIMIPIFVKKGLKAKLEEKHVTRIKEIMEEMKNGI